MDLILKRFPWHFSRITRDHPDSYQCKTNTKNRCPVRIASHIFHPQLRWERTTFVIDSQITEIFLKRTQSNAHSLSVLTNSPSQIIHDAVVVFATRHLITFIHYYCHVSSSHTQRDGDNRLSPTPSAIKRQQNEDM